MLPIPALTRPREDWSDADFELPDGDAIISSSIDSDREDMDEGQDWDNMLVEEQGQFTPHANKHSSSNPTMVTIQPPFGTHSPPLGLVDDEEGVSTIKVSSLPTLATTLAFSPPIDEDLENAFALPSDLSQLSLRPLHHRSSRSSIEWGEKDHTAPSSSATSLSSDAYSSLGFGQGASPSSASTHSRVGSHLTSETEDEADAELDGDLDGLVLPSSIFESRQGGKELARILDVKKKLPPVGEVSKPIGQDEDEADFEAGLLINDDMELNPSRLLLGHKLQSGTKNGPVVTRSKSAPSHPTAIPRPPSRLRGRDQPHVKTALKSKSPVPSIASRPPSRLASGSPPLYAPATRLPVFNNGSSRASVSPPSGSRPTSTSLRGQKSLLGFHTLSARKSLARKASLSSLLDDDPDCLTPGSSSLAAQSQGASYNSSTVASRAKSHHIHGSSYPRLPDTSTPYGTHLRALSPSLTTSAYRLTLPTSLSKTKTRPAISSIFPETTSQVTTPFGNRTCLPQPSASGSATSERSIARRFPATSDLIPTVTSTKILRKPKRLRMYGDGTELDSIDDLPTDREKESRFRIAPKPSVNRVPGATYSPSLTKEAGLFSKGSLNESNHSEHYHLGVSGTYGHKPAATSLGSLRRRRRIDASLNELNVANKKSPIERHPSASTKRRPTLIRNLSGVGAPKVIGEMRWNPHSLRWEGNEQVLRDFEVATGTSTRPALITHLTGSSLGSPVSGFTAGARVVGNMIFDPVKMCWLSRLPAEEEEPDPFADMDDDDDSWEGKGGTIRASRQMSEVTNAQSSSSSRSIETPSPSASHLRSMSESDSEPSRRTSRPVLVVADVDETFVKQCQSAEGLHQEDVMGWILPAGQGRPALYYIRELATKSY